MSFLSPARKQARASAPRERRPSYRAFRSQTLRGGNLRLGISQAGAASHLAILEWVLVLRAENDAVLVHKGHQGVEVQGGLQGAEWRRRPQQWKQMPKRTFPVRLGEVYVYQPRLHASDQDTSQGDTTPGVSDTHPEELQNGLLEPRVLRHGCDSFATVSRPAQKHGIGRRVGHESRWAVGGSFVL